MFHRRHWFLLAVIMLTVAGTAFIYLRVRESVEAEKTLHAYRIVLDVLVVYLRESNGQWPRSWNELSRVSPDEGHGIFDWPNDIPEIRKRIHIRFDVTASEVATMDSERFDAVEQVGPNYGVDFLKIERLKEIARLYGE